MIRQVAIDAEQIALVEEAGIELLRREDHRASKLLALLLAWRFAAEAAPSSGSNMANVVAFDTYSRKVVSS